MIAAFFADGTVSGDLSWISATVAEQRRAYQDIAKATGLLRKAVEDGTDRAGVIKQFEEWQQAVLPAGMPASPSPGSTAGYGWNRRNLSAGGSKAGLTPPPARLSIGALAPGAALWLIQEKGKDFSESIQLLAEWRERIGPIGLMSEVGELPSAPGRPHSAPAQAFSPAMVGKAAPDFTLKDVDGRQFALKDLRGKTVFLNFWATWCEPCRLEMPQIQALNESFKDKGLVAIGINYSESAETAKKYFSQEKHTFPNLLAPNGEAFEKYGAGSIPKIVLIDKDGIVRYFQQGYNSRQDFHAEVTKLGL